MRYLLDTHLLLWTAMGSPRLKPSAAAIIEDTQNELNFSAASIWEIAIKNSQGRDSFAVDPAILRDGLIANGMTELAISAAHACATDALPMLHNDPFDRMLIAQATEEGMTLLTSDKAVADYRGSVRKV